jgi:hypothetical protein
MAIFMLIIYWQMCGKYLAKVFKQSNRAIVFIDSKIRKASEERNVLL